jgi:hypothetical protein
MNRRVLTAPHHFPGFLVQILPFTARVYVPAPPVRYAVFRALPPDPEPPNTSANILQGIFFFAVFPFPMFLMGQNDPF